MTAVSLTAISPQGFRIMGMCQQKSGYRWVMPWICLCRRRAPGWGWRYQTLYIKNLWWSTWKICFIGESVRGNIWTDVRHISGTRSTATFLHTSLSPQHVSDPVLLQLGEWENEWGPLQEIPVWCANNHKTQHLFFLGAPLLCMSVVCLERRSKRCYIGHGAKGWERLRMCEEVTSELPTFGRTL